MGALVVKLWARAIDSLRLLMYRSRAVKLPLLLDVTKVQSEGTLNMVVALLNPLLAARSLPYALHYANSLEKWLSVGSDSLLAFNCISYLVIWSSVK